MIFKVTNINEETVVANSIEEVKDMYPNAKVEEIVEKEELNLSEVFANFLKAKEQLNREIQSVKDLENELHRKEAEKFKEVIDYLKNEVEPIIKKFRRDFLIFGFKGKNYIIRLHETCYGVDLYKGSLTVDGNDDYSINLVDTCGNFYISDSERERYSDYGSKKLFVRNWDEAKVSIKKELIIRMQKELVDIKAKNDENRETVLKLLNK